MDPRAPLVVDGSKIDVQAYKAFKPSHVYKNTEIDVESKPNEKMNVCNAINNAMKVSMKEDERVVLLGEDVAFGGVFRCSVDLRE